MLVSRLRRGQRHAGAREALIRTFMDGVPPEWFQALHDGPNWPLYQAMAPTLLGDAEALAWTELAPRVQLWSGITARTTGLLGQNTFNLFNDAAEAILHALPGARRGTVTSGDSDSWEPGSLADAIAQACQ